MEQQKDNNNQTLTHWKKLVNKDYLGSHDFPVKIIDGKPVYEEFKVTIDSVTKEMLELFNGTRKESREHVVVRFKNAKKPMLFNKENLKLTTKTLKTAFIEQWVGKQITLHVVPVSAFGEVVDAVRVKFIKQ